jgi:hypothetical protein
MSPPRGKAELPPLRKTLPMRHSYPLLRSAMKTLFPPLLPFENSALSKLLAHSLVSDDNLSIPTTVESLLSSSEQSPYTKLPALGNQKTPQGPWLAQPVLP